MAGYSGEHRSALLDAVETLSCIADLEFDHDIGIIQRHEHVIRNQKITSKTVHWLHARHSPEISETTLNVVRETFRSVLHYIGRFYQKEYRKGIERESIGRIKAMMTLVTDAARKLDRYTSLFHRTQNVQEFEEYTRLKVFYEEKMLRAGGERPEPENTLAEIAENNAVSSGIGDEFIDFEALKRDSEYELLYIRKENGNAFYSRELLRSIRLAFDLGVHFKEHKENPLEALVSWRDRIVHACACEIMKSAGPSIGRFFKEMKKHARDETDDLLNKALMALMFASHSQNLLRHHPVKSCTEYFKDFQTFLRLALHSRPSLAEILTSEKESTPQMQSEIDLIQVLCGALYGHLKGVEEMISIVRDLIAQSKTGTSAGRMAEATEKNRMVDRLRNDYTAMTERIKPGFDFRLKSVPDTIEEYKKIGFDSILQGNLPGQLFDLYTGEKRCRFLRIPSPTSQKTIQAATVNPEFIGFLGRYAEKGMKHLVINLQDRTSWKEHARSLALEELSEKKGIERAIHVVTLAVDTDFYHQLHPYHESSRTQDFMDRFKEMIADEQTGYYLPGAVDRKELTFFIDGAFKTIHRVFFSEKNVLTRESRIAFIELFYGLLQLKLIDLLQPDSVSITCKDGVDLSQASVAELFALISSINHRGRDEENYKDYLNYLLYGPALAVRERVMLPARFNRFISTMKAIENTRDELGSEAFVKTIERELKPLYHTKIWNSQVSLPQ